MRVTHRTNPARSLGLTAALSALALLPQGCASRGAGDSAQRPGPGENWSTKSESVVAITPAANVDLGPQIPVEVDKNNLRRSAIEVLQRGADSTNPLLRANSIEGLKHAPQGAAIAAIRRGLGDENRAVRFAATMLAGELQLKEMRTLVEPLLKDESASVQAAAIYAVKRMGGQPNQNPLSAMLLGDDAEVRGNAAYVLGELGEPSAASLLRYAAGRGLMKTGTARRKVVELQIAEAMVKLGDLQQLEVIRASLFSRPEEAELTALACQICGEVKDEGALPNLLDLATREGRRQGSREVIAAPPAEVRMAAATAVARIDPQKAILGVGEAYMGHSRFELRAQAASTLGASHQAAALPLLARMLSDGNPLVQISAAAAVLEIESAGP